MFYVSRACLFDTILYKSPYFSTFPLPDTFKHEDNHWVLLALCMRLRDREDMLGTIDTAERFVFAMVTSTGICTTPHPRHGTRQSTASNLMIHHLTRYSRLIPVVHDIRYLNMAR